ncbi:MAG: PIN domain-containing protein [Candidatus Acidiferrales bacterium]
MPTPNLLFIDTNIWLDFYRARNETGLKLLRHAEALSDRLIVTYQLESEFKKNRQIAIIEGMQELKAPQQIPRVGIFSDTKATAIMERQRKETENRIKVLKARLGRVLKNPAVHDPVYKTCQRVFHKGDDLSLTRDNPFRRRIRTMALKRFLHGCPPRKKNDTSIGDAINWEWMVECTARRKAGLIIVSRDSDYGATVDGVSYINDHLRQEFSDRVSRKRKLLLYSRLSDALKLFKIEVSAQEEESENQLVTDVEDRKNPDTVPLSALGDVLSARYSLGISGIECLEALRNLLAEGMKESS